MLYPTNVNKLNVIEISIELFIFSDFSIKEKKI